MGCFNLFSGTGKPNIVTGHGWFVSLLFQSLNTHHFSGPSITKSCLFSDTKTTVGRSVEWHCSPIVIGQIILGYALRTNSSPT